MKGRCFLISWENRLLAYQEERCSMETFKNPSIYLFLVISDFFLYECWLKYCGWKERGFAESRNVRRYSNTVLRMRSVFWGMTLVFRWKSGDVSEFMPPPSSASINKPGRKLAYENRWQAELKTEVKCFFETSADSQRTKQKIRTLLNYCR
jgi:hypothetical protein